MAITQSKNGYALIVAVVLTSVMLTFGLALGSLAYKQKMLATDAIESQYAFYAADSALECALYADQQLNNFSLDGHDATTHPDGIVCNNAVGTETAYQYGGGTLLVRQQLNIGPQLCADVVVQKTAIASNNTIFAQGYDASCADVNAGTRVIVSRGLKEVK